MHISVGSVDAWYLTNSSGIGHMSCRIMISDPELTRGATASPSLACSNQSCTRCLSGASHLCCDTCNPGSFILPVPASATLKQSRAPNKFKVDSGGYLMTEADRKLREALCNWRRTQLQALGASTDDDMFGSQLIMTDDILERILDLAHFGQIDNLATLQNQVTWRYWDRWGPPVLDIVKTHFPFVADALRGPLQPAENIPGPSTGNLPPSTASGSMAASTVRAAASARPATAKSGSKPRKRGPYRCGSCHSTTHIGMLSILSIFR